MPTTEDDTSIDDLRIPIRNMSFCIFYETLLELPKHIHCAVHCHAWHVMATVITVIHDADESVKERGV